MKTFRLLMITVFAVMIILSLSALGIGKTKTTTNNLRYGMGTMANKTVISFNTPLAAPPVVIPSGQWNSLPWLTAATNITAKSFSLIFYNPNNHTAVDNPQSTFTQYIAVVPDPKSPILRAGVGKCQDGDYIKFSSKLSTNPIVVCSAENGSGVPLYAGPYNIAPDKFQISLKDMEGNPAKGVVQYIAIIPGSSPVDYQNVIITAGGIEQASEGRLNFGYLMAKAPEVMVCSVYAPRIADVATSWFYDDKSFQAVIRNFDNGDPDGEVANPDPANLYWFGLYAK